MTNLKKLFPFQNKALRIIVSVIISTTFVYFLIRKFNFAKVFEIMESASLKIWVLGSFAYILSFLPRTYRWKALLEGSGNPPEFKKLFPILTLGYGINNLLPLRLGDVTRAGLYKFRRKAGFAYTLTTIGAEKVWDISFLLVMVPLLQLTPVAVLFQGLLSIIPFTIITGLGIGAFIVLRYEESFAEIIPWNKLEEIYRSILQGIKDAKKAGITRVFLLTSVIWGIEIFSAYLVGMSLNEPIPLYASLASIVALNFGIMIPSAPAYLGIFESFAVAPLLLLGIAEKNAMAFALFLHLAQIIPLTIFTAYLLMFTEVGTPAIKQIKNRFISDED